MFINRGIEYKIITKNQIQNDYIISAIRISNVKENAVIRFIFKKNHKDILIAKTYKDHIRQMILIMNNIQKNHEIKIKLQGTDKINLRAIKIIEFFYNDKKKITSKEYWRILN